MTEIVGGGGDGQNLGEPQAETQIPIERNMYDQHPFDVVIPNVITANPLFSQDEARRAISIAVSIVYENDKRWKALEVDQGRDEMEYQRSMAIGEAIKAKIKGKFELPADADHFGMNLINEIEKFPLLADYILLKVLEGRRKLNGDVKKSASVLLGEIPEDSYVLWASRRLRVDQNSVLLGIDKIFRQNVHREILAKIVSPEDDDAPIS